MDTMNTQITTVEYELMNFPKKYSEQEVDLLRTELFKEGKNMELFFQDITEKGYLVCSSRTPIEDKLRVRYSNYSFNGKKYLHYMKIPYFAFITALHEKLDFFSFIDSNKVEREINKFGSRLELNNYIQRFSPNPNSSYNTDPNMPRGVAFESCFIPEIMKLSLKEYIEMIREKGMLEKGYIYVVENKNMIPSYRYPNMEYHCFEDMPFLARFPISRKLDWNYKTNIRVQEISLDKLHKI